MIGLIIILFSLLGIKFGEQNWRHTQYCPHCGKYFDQPKKDNTDWRPEIEK